MNFTGTCASIGASPKTHTLSIKYQSSFPRVVEI